MAILAKAPVSLYLQSSKYQITLAPIWFSQLNHLRINVVSVCLLAWFPRPPGPATSRNVKINGLIFSKDTHKTTSTVEK